MTTRRTSRSSGNSVVQQEQAVCASRGIRRLPVEERGLGTVLFLSAVLALLLIAQAAAEAAEARRTDTLTLPASGRTAVRVEGTSGAVAVRGGDAETVTINSEVIARGRDDRQARELLASARVRADTEGSRIVIRLERPDSERRVSLGLQRLKSLLRGESDDVVANFDLVVPSRMAVVVDLTSGKVNVGGVQGKVSIDATSSDVEIVRAGAVELDVTSGDARLRDLEGPVVFDGTSGRLDLEGCRGDLRVDVTSGDVTVSDLRGDVAIDGMSCDARLKGISGDVTFDTVTGGLSLSDFIGSLDMDTSSGGLDFAGTVPARGHVRAETISGNLRLALGELRDATLQVRSDHGRVDAGAFAGALRADREKRQLAGVLGGGRSIEIRLHSTSGDITLAGR